MQCKTTWSEVKSIVQTVFERPAKLNQWKYCESNKPTVVAKQYE